MNNENQLYITFKAVDQSASALFLLPGEFQVSFLSLGSGMGKHIESQQTTHSYLHVTLMRNKCSLRLLLLQSYLMQCIYHVAKMISEK